MIWLSLLEKWQANMAYEFTFLIVGILALGYVIVIKKEKPTVEYFRITPFGSVFEMESDGILIETSHLNDSFLY